MNPTHTKSGTRPPERRPPLTGARLLGAVCAVVISGLAGAAPSVEAQGPTPKVLLIGIDGVRPDVLAEVRTPNIDALIAEGAYSADANTTRQNHGLEFRLTRLLQTPFTIPEMPSMLPFTASFSMVAAPSTAPPAAAATAPSTVSWMSIVIVFATTVPCWLSFSDSVLLSTHHCSLRLLVAAVALVVGSAAATPVLVQQPSSFVAAPRSRRARAGPHYSCTCTRLPSAYQVRLNMYMYCY